MNKTLTLVLAAAGAASLSAGAASAQEWMSINERQRMLDDRIEAGVRSNQLTRAEAQRLRTEFREIARIEAGYRRDGLTRAERQYLDERFDRLAARVRFERTDWQRDWFGRDGWRDDRGEWVNINRRQRQLDRRIDQGLRSGQLTRAEAVRLRAEFRELARVEARYRRGGLSRWEMADLDRRFDSLAMRVRWERTDGQRYGWNRW